MPKLMFLPLLVGCSEFNLFSQEEKAADGLGELVVDPGLLDFGVLLDGEEVDQIVTLSSVGALPVAISAIDVEGSGAFTVTGFQDGLTLEPGASTELIVTYVPDLLADSGQLVVESDAVEPFQTVELRGARAYAGLEFSPPEVALYSNLGEPVTEEVVVTSVGTIDLELYDMTVQGGQFTAEGGIPTTLPPGASTTLTVTYTPEVPGETVEGWVWLKTNTPAGYDSVPLVGTQDPECVGLGEAWDRGDLSAIMRSSSSLEIENHSPDEAICIDRWYVWMSEGSQDLGAGDMNGDESDLYPLGSLEIADEDSLFFDGAGSSGPSWYCMEKTQQTRRMGSYEFLGARVPEPMLSLMRDGDQDASWAWQSANPVMITGRRTNLVELPESGGTETVGFRVINMGSMDGVAEVRETVPAGFSATDFSTVPSLTEAGDDGATVYVFSVSLEAREETGLSEHTIYDEIEISYKLTVPECSGRQHLPPTESRWYDADDVLRTATANPMVILCE